MVCPECGAEFVGNKLWRTTPHASRFGAYYRRCPAGHEFPEPKKVAVSRWERRFRTLYRALGNEGFSAGAYGWVAAYDTPIDDAIAIIDRLIKEEKAA